MTRKFLFILSWFLVLLLTACDVLPSLDQTLAPQEEPTQVEAPLQPTAEWTASALPPVETAAPAATLAPTVTNAPTIQETITPEPTIFPLETIQPAYLANFNHPEKGCSWMGAAGQVFEADGKPAVGLVVVVQGDLGGTPVDMVSMTGQATAYGPGGFEIELANKPVASTSSISIQIFDLEGKPLSGTYTFDTLADCQKNLVLINFTRKTGENQQFIPMISQ